VLAASAELAENSVLVNHLEFVVEFIELIDVFGHLARGAARDTDAPLRVVSSIHHVELLPLDQLLLTVAVDTLIVEVAMLNIVRLLILEGFLKYFDFVVHRLELSKE